METFTKHTVGEMRAVARRRVIVLRDEKLDVSRANGVFHLPDTEPVSDRGRAMKSSEQKQGAPEMAPYTREEAERRWEEARRRARATGESLRTLAAISPGWLER